MSFITRGKIDLNPTSPNFDMFGRQKVSNPQTLFDSKLLWDKAPLFWREATVSGSGFTSTYLPNESAVLLETDGTEGRFIRQTAMRMNYQPGKAQSVDVTGVLDLSGQGKLEVVRRTSTSGSPVDEAISQENFNGNYLYPEYTGEVMDSFNIGKSQILTIEFEWLGVGTVRMGKVKNGSLTPLHYFLNDNISDKVYMRTPNLPMRYEMEVTATEVIKKVGYFDDNNGLFFQTRVPVSAGEQMKCICSTVISDGGSEDTGVLRYASTNGVHVDANAADTLYAVLGVRLKATHLDASVKLIRASLLAETQDSYEWTLLYNPTVEGTFTYSGLADSCIEVARGATANTVTGGISIDGGFANTSASISALLTNALRLGADIDNTPDTIVLCARPLGSNSDIQGSLTWRELS